MHVIDNKGDIPVRGAKVSALFPGPGNVLVG